MLNGPVTTYSCDIKLLARYGIEPFVIPQGIEHDVGTIELDNLGTTIHLSVIGYPAQFWRATITSAESKKRYQVRTGSGALEQYFKTFEDLAEGMVVITEVDHYGESQKPDQKV